MEPPKDKPEPDPDEIVSGGRSKEPQPGDRSAGGEPVDAAEHDPAPDETT